MIPNPPLSDADVPMSQREHGEQWLARQFHQWEQNRSQGFTLPLDWRKYHAFARIAADAIAKVVEARDAQWTTAAREVASANMMPYGEGSEMHLAAASAALTICGRALPVVPWHAIEEGE